MTRLQDSEADPSNNLDTAPVQNVTSNVAKVLEKQKEDKKKEVDAEGGPSKPKERKKKKSKKGSFFFYPYCDGWFDFRSAGWRS
ncbi:hypothetical protein P8452_47467 [Trifolium repens]|jgi:hypothetical protein|nr:hypothetical protein P8452_47467 [Trifolium repens]